MKSIKPLLGWIFAGMLPAAVLATGERDAALGAALVHHVSFDKAFAADFSRGDSTLYQFTTRPQRLAMNVPAVAGDTLQLAPGEGRFGGALHRPKAGPVRLFYRGAGLIDSEGPSLSGSVSVWLKTTPDQDLPAAFCDPIMIISDDHRQGFLFVEWSRDHSPKEFRYAVVPPSERWNPQDKPWEEVPAIERPMIQLKHRPFSRDRWTHVAFTFDRINEGRAATARLYIDGVLEGTIAGWDLTFSWNPAQVILAVGWSYVGMMDDLAVFNRALTSEEVRRLTELPGGIGSLHRGANPTSPAAPSSR